MYPEYLIEYPNMNTHFPFYIKRKQHTLVPPHRHDFIEFTLILSGRGKEYINGSVHPMAPGTIVLLLPYQVHRIEADPQAPLDMYICNFDIKLLTEGTQPRQRLWDLIFGGDNEPLSFVQVDATSFQEIRKQFEILLKEYCSNEFGREVMIKAKLLESLTIFARNIRNANNKPGYLESVSPFIPKPVWQMVKYIHEHYMESISLSVLSEAFQLHPAYISELFSEHYGIPFLEFVQELRIRHACSLLLSSDMPLSQVSAESGFDSYPTFNRTFRKLKGVSPRTYKGRFRRG
jgi:AraC-like DNA-binding protein